jgi:ferritin-like metal-binding protein YciE
MGAATLRDLFLDELRDLYDAEHQLTKTLQKLSEAATSADLKRAFDEHLVETRGHVQHLERVFAIVGEAPEGVHCDGMAGIIDEGSAMMKEDLENATMDACLIAAGQRAEHYEMAAYGTMVAWALALGYSDAAEVLDKTLDEEKAADVTLTSLAQGGINRQAAEAAA